MSVQDELKKAVNPAAWKKANQRMVAKMLSEYMYEDMLHPVQLDHKDGIAQYELIIHEHKKYRYLAKPRLFDSFDTIAKSIECCQDGKWSKDLSAIVFLLDIQPLIPMSSETTGHLIKELHHTLLADVHLLSKKALRADELTDTDYAWIEGEMTGHPWIVYNKGRIGFSYDDYLAYAPERQESVQLSWIAVHRDLATFHAVDHENYEQVIAKELDEVTIRQFHRVLKDEGLNTADYYLMPVHKWQWTHMIIQHFPEDLALRRIVYVGEGLDQYIPQQSIRTFTNISNKGKHHIKLPMSILNTLVYRGLPSERTVIAPRITAHIKGIADQDSFLSDVCRVILPGENASINVDHPYYSKLPGAPYQYLEMLGVIFRESIYSYLDEGENPVTLAALTYEDHEGEPYVKQLIEKSGLSAKEWMAKFFHVVMPPLLHFMYQYGTVFSPHGQNTILVLKDHQPHRLAIKDFVDDVNISDQPLPELASLGEDLKEVLRSEPPEGLVQFIFTGLFICNLRYVSNVLDNHQLLDETALWRLLAEEIQQYQKQFPQLKDRFDLFDLFQPKLTKLCLNRNRMIDYGYGDGDDRPHASEHGKVTNALAHVLSSVGEK
ncbi:IucA/IucC family siderophore biosynthesis protein [Bacillus pumilus]|uniref:IucA/IucC family protein n=1 Tax=Bacillus pumilus TaxID=1408 RepID=UPI0029C23346|nr:IucA/IucC family siderophore biosynthesis protein [Bacillus pumilus]MDX5485393.1 IucA/IucC family siderophore biosynthesis protein [Bacillus pumilus]